MKKKKSSITDPFIVIAVFTLIIGPIVAPLLFLFAVSLPLYLQGNPQGVFYLCWAMILVALGIPMGIFWSLEIFAKDCTVRAPSR